MFPSAQPAAPLPPQTIPGPQPAPLTPDEVSAWKRRLTASVDPIKRIIAEGKKHTRRYEGKPLGVTPTSDTVVVPLDFSYVEQKKAQLCFQVPELHLTGARPDCEAAAPIAQAVINEALGPYGVKAKAMMFEALTDVLCPTGYAVTVIGYTPFIDGEKDVQVGEEQVPVEQPGAILGLTTPTQTQPIMQSVPNVIAENYYWNRLPPGFLRAPAEFRGSDFDQAPWIAYRFAEDQKDDTGGKRRGGGSSRNDDDEMLLTEIPTDSRGPKRWGTRVYYRAHQFDADAKHPELIRTFVLYDDETEAKDRKNSPYQRWGQDGAPVGMVGYPVHVLTLRYLPDSCFPPSDVQMSRQQVDELGKGRTQMVQRRNRSLPQVGYDATRVIGDSLAKLQANENTGFVGFNGPIDDGMMKAIEKGTYGRENFEFDNVIKGDIDQLWALGANAGVLRAGGNETATKATQIQSAVDTRLEAERARVLEFLVAGAMKLFALKQLFATNEEYVRVVGPDGVARLTPWSNQSIPGQYAFKAKPDSHIRIDAAQDREQKIQGYNLLRKDPMVSPEEVIKPIAALMGYDMTRLMKPPEPPKAEPPRISLSFQGADLWNPVVLDLLVKQGVQIDPNAVAQMQQMIAAGLLPMSMPGAAGAGTTEHGGAAPKPEPIDKHIADLSGHLPGPGVM